MQALLHSIFVLWCILCAPFILAHELTGIDTLSNEAAQQYVFDYKDIAVNDMHKTGIPASIKLAQAMFESNFGRSDLAIKGNNHFGIKCYRSWKGDKLYYNDDKPNECFRQYDWVADSYVDHSRIITSKRRYTSLFELAPIDYKGWAKGLQKAGYATDPQYADKLIWMIEKHDLHQYDFEEDPYINLEDMPILASKEEVNNDLDGPIIYAYKFGDIQKTAPNKLKAHKNNSYKLLKPNPSTPKKDLLPPSFADNQSSPDIHTNNSKSTNKAHSPIKNSPYSSEAFLNQRNPIFLSTLPKEPVKMLNVPITKEVNKTLPFNKRTLPQIPFWVERVEIKTNALPSKPVVNITNFNENTAYTPTVSFNKRTLPQIPFWVERVEIKTDALPSKPVVNIVVFNENNAYNPTASFNKRTFTQITLLEEEVMQETSIDALVSSPSVVSEAGGAIVLSHKEITYLNKLKMVQYEKMVSLKDLSTTYQIPFDELMRYNDIADSIYTFSTHTPIYLEAKKSKPSSSNQKEHLVESDETMWEIAQLYGVQLEVLLARNHLEANEEPRNGETILLRSQAPYPPKIKREKPTANVSEEFKKEVLKEIREKKATDSEIGKE